MNDPYRILPPANAAQRAELLASIKAVGLKNPVIVDEKGQIIDGHERRDTCKSLGIDWLKGADVRLGLSEIQKKALAIELNLPRRAICLTNRQRTELLDIYLCANPQLSEPQVAVLFAVNQSTVNRRKKELMRKHKLKPVLATVGRDGVTRKVGQRGGRFVVRNARELESLKPTFAEVGHELTGLVRRQRKLHAVANRKRLLAKVNSTDISELPTAIEIHHCDFRNLPVADGSVDRIITDVVWSLEAEKDWRDLTACAVRWLKPDGLFVSMIGTSVLPYFCRVVMEQFRYAWTIAVTFPMTKSCNMGSRIRESWRPVVVFSKASQRLFKGVESDLILTGGPEKDYHDWQQKLSVFSELVRKLSNPGHMICDPQMGTGTTAVACLEVGQRKFIGCDIDEQQVRTSRYRVATYDTDTFKKCQF